MQVADMTYYCVATPPPHLGGSYWQFVTLTTDDGVQGVGEIYAATFHSDVMARAVKDVYERYLHGHDPHHLERFYREAYSSGFTQRPDLTMMGIVSGLEMACWDIIGKAAGQPVYELIGGKVHDRLRSYTYLYPENSRGEYDYDDPELGAEYAAGYADEGFTAIKFDPAGPYTAYSGHQLSLAKLEHCERYCQQVREAVGSRCDLLIGTHGQMVPSSAIRLAKRLEPFDPLWLEEPVPPGQTDAMA
jgi:galactonate dehydratase